MRPDKYYTFYFTGKVKYNKNKENKTERYADKLTLGKTVKKKRRTTDKNFIFNAFFCCVPTTLRYMRKHYAIYR